MKHFWNKLLFRDAPAEGAFFALTLWITAGYVVGSLLFFLWVNGLVRDVTLPVIGFLPVPLYFLVMTFRFLYLRRLEWQGGFVLLIPPVLMLSLPLFLLTGLPFDWMAVVPLLVVLLFSLCFCRGDRLWAAGCVAMWLTGVFMLFLGVLPWEHAFERFSEIVPGSALEQQGIFRDGVLWVGFTWLLLLGWYLSTAKLISGWGEVRFRSLFGKPVFAVWGVAAAVYLTFSVMAVVGERKVERQVKALGNFFGRPVTVGALRELYFEGGQPDATFWQQIKGYNSKLDEVPADAFSVYSTTATGVDAELLRSRFREQESTLAAWESAFAGPIPWYDPDFKERNLLNLQEMNLDPMRRFIRAELWRIRFALEDGDPAAAIAAERRIGNVCRALRRVGSMMGGLMWRSGQRLRLDGYQLLLESGRLTEPQLRELENDLRQTEEEIPRIRMRSHYAEAVLELDNMKMLASLSSLDFPGHWRTPAVPVRSFFGFLPQLRWYFTEEMSDTIFCAESSGKNDCPSRFLRPLTGMMQPAWSLYDAAFRQLTAQLRAMRGLVAAELYKREHGDYPETMAGLLPDPFSGKPLLYRKGECPWQEESLQWIQPEEPEEKFPVFQPESLHWERQIRQTTVPAVQVWSVGPNGKNDDGNGDDIRAVMRMQGGK